MADEKKVVTKRSGNTDAIKAASLLEEAAVLLQGVKGKNAEALQYIAGRIDWCREKILENK